MGLGVQSHSRVTTTPRHPLPLVTYIPDGDTNPTVVVTTVEGTPNVTEVDDGDDSKFFVDSHQPLLNVSHHGRPCPFPLFGLAVKIIIISVFAVVGGLFIIIATALSYKNHKKHLAQRRDSVETAKSGQVLPMETIGHCDPEDPSSPAERKRDDIADERAG